MDIIGTALDEALAAGPDAGHNAVPGLATAVEEEGLGSHEP